MRLRRLCLAGLLGAFALFAPQAAIAQTMSPPALYDRGIASQRSGDFFTAIEAYQGALNQNPSFVGPIVGLAQCYFALGEYQESLKWAQQAEGLDRTNLQLVNLEGRSRVGLGDFATARQLFMGVIAKEPNNLDAQFGLAEIDVATGQPRTGAAKFQDALRMAPENRRALLSLVIVYDSLGNFAKAEESARTALDAYPDDPQVHLVAARHWIASGDYADALGEVERALAIKPGDVSATLTLSEILLRTDQYAKVIPRIEEILAKNRDSYLLLYSLGLAQSKMNDVAGAITSFSQAFGTHPDDEISRMAMENEIIDKLDMKDPRRAQFAKYHFDQGAAFLGQNFVDRALLEYRRGLKIDPLDKGGRLAYAGIFKLEGQGAKYLSELGFLQQNGLADTDVQDETDVQTNLLSDSVSNTWGIDQFNVPRESYALTLFYATNTPMVHYLAQGTIAQYVRDLFSTYENTKVPSPPQGTSGFGDAFRTARQSGSDYFLILSPLETDRYFKIDADLYVSSTGSKVKSFSVYRTGNGRVTDALSHLADSVHSVLPQEGKLEKRQFDQGVIDLGDLDGVKVNDSLLIVKNGSLALAKDRLGFAYPKDGVIGNFVVSRTDALVSEGKIVKNQFFDLINVGDWVIYSPPKDTQPTIDAAPASDVYQTILRIPSN